MGTVTDATGGAVPGAVAEIRNARTNQTWTTKTNAFGNYEFSSSTTADRECPRPTGSLTATACMAATCSTRFKEPHNVQFRAEFFNFFNHVNLGAPERNLRAPDTFGRILGSGQGAGVANDQRIIQFALKYQF